MTNEPFEYMDKLEAVSVQERDNLITANFEPLNNYNDFPYSPESQLKILPQIYKFKEQTTESLPDDEYIRLDPVVSEDIIDLTKFEYSDNPAFEPEYGPLGETASTIALAGFALSALTRSYKEKFRSKDSDEQTKDGRMRRLFEGAKYLVGDYVSSDEAVDRMKERQAHGFRSKRMRLTDRLSTITRRLQSKPVEKRMVSAFTSPEKAAQMAKGTQREGEMHRTYTPLIAGLMNDEQMRGEFLGAIDEASEAESRDLKQEARREGVLSTDVLVIGAGLQSAVFSSELRSQRPDARILAIDSGKQLGGQFRSYGERPTFFINSRNNRAQDNDMPELPGGNGNLNSLGDKAPLQLTDISSETYPSNVELGDTAAVNHFLSAESMLGVRFASIVEKRDHCLVIVIDEETGEEYSIKANKVVLASGAGQREGSDVRGVMSAEQMFAHFGNHENLFPMDIFIDKKVAIVGGGDSGRVIAELLTRLGPKAAYGKSSVQLGGPASISWFGTDFATRDEFCETNRPRYQRLASFIPKKNKGAKSNPGLIDCTKERISTIAALADGKIGILTEGNRAVSDFDIVIDARNLSSSVLEVLINQMGLPPEPVKINLGQGIGRATSGLRIGRHVTVVGPAAKSPLTATEQSTFADGIKENTVAIWANQARTEAMAGLVANELSS